jgi:hypothetical protein
MLSPARIQSEDKILSRQLPEHIRACPAVEPWPDRYRNHGSRGLGCRNWQAIGLVALVGSSSVIAAIVTQAIGWLLGAHTRRRAEIKEGKFAALYLAITFESYACACATLIQSTAAD